VIDKTYTCKLQKSYKFIIKSCIVLAVRYAIITTNCTGNPVTASDLTQRKIYKATYGT